MARVIELSRADLLRIAREGFWVFLALVISGAVVITTLVYRSDKRSMLFRPELEFRFTGDLSQIEETHYFGYFSNLDIADIDSRPVRIKQNTILVPVSVSFNGADDPRLRRIIAGLLEVREKAMQQLEKQRGLLVSEERMIEKFLEHLKLINDDDPENEALSTYTQMRLTEVSTLRQDDDTRLALRDLPVLVRFTERDLRKSLALALIFVVPATLLTALAGGFVFGYGRLLSSRAAVR